MMQTQHRTCNTSEIQWQNWRVRSSVTIIQALISKDDKNRAIFKTTMTVLLIITWYLLDFFLWCNQVWVQSVIFCLNFPSMGRYFFSWVGGDKTRATREWILDMQTGEKLKEKLNKSVARCWATMCHQDTLVVINDPQGGNSLVIATQWQTRRTTEKTIKKIILYSATASRLSSFSPTCRFCILNQHVNFVDLNSLDAISQAHSHKEQSTC